MTGTDQSNSPGKSHLINYAVILSCAIIILAGIHVARTILSPIFMATFFAVLLLPPLRWLRAKGFSEFSSLTVVILSVLICGMGVATIVGTQLTQFARSLPTLRRDFNEKLMNYDLDLGDFIPLLKTTPPAEENNPSGRNLRESVPQDRNHRAGHSPQTGSGAIVPVSYVQSEQGNSPPAAAPKTPAQEDKTSHAATPATPATETASAGQTSSDKATLTPDANAASGRSAAASGQAGRDMPGGFFDPSPLDVRQAPPESLDPETGNSEEHPDSANSPNAWIKPSDAMEVSSQELFKFVAGLTGELSMLASSTFIIMLLVIFMLLEASKLPEKISKALGNRTFMSQRVRQLTNDIRRYMLIKTFVSILVGFFVTILLLVTGVQYPFLWGFVAFLLNFIPNIGSVVAAIPPILLALSQQGLVIGCVNIAFFLIINCSIGYLLEPKLLGNGLDLSPLVVLLSLIFCGWILGAVGMFLSPPLAVIIKIILQSFPETRWIAVLMANRVPKDPGPEPEPEIV